MLIRDQIPKPSQSEKTLKLAIVSFILSQILAIFILGLFFSSVVQAKSVERIITLSPNTTELAFSAGLGDKIIAVSEYSDYPTKASTLETVANYQGINLERIITLKPDLVIHDASFHLAGLEQLEALGIPTYASSILTLDDIANELEHLGQWADDPQIATEKAEQFRQQLQALIPDSDAHKIRYFYRISSRPLISVADPHWPTDVFNQCGGENALSSTIAYPQLSIESVIKAQPEVIISARTEPNWQQWQSIPAVKNKRFLLIDPDTLTRPTLRTLEAVKLVCEYFDEI